MISLLGLIVLKLGMDHLLHQRLKVAANRSDGQ
jgi:hypothetical protein